MVDANDPASAVAQALAPAPEEYVPLWQSRITLSAPAYEPGEAKKHDEAAPLLLEPGLHLEIPCAFVLVGTPLLSVVEA